MLSGLLVDIHRAAKYLNHLMCTFPALMCPVEKIRILDKHHSGMSYSAFGHEFSANELMIYIKVPLNRNTEKKIVY